MYIRLLTQVSKQKLFVCQLVIQSCYTVLVFMHNHNMAGHVAVLQYP